ncbi:acetyltransferase [Escherichia coli]|nr:acetyltransferase [Escherichia coli]
MQRTSLFLSVCYRRNAHGTPKSVDWWGQHLTEAKQKQAECEKSGSDSQNCKNVKQALFIQSQKDAPVPTFD